MFPLLMGLTTGAAVLFFTRLLHVGHRRTLLFGSILAGCATVGIFHLVSFQLTQRTLRELWVTKRAEMQQAQLLSPESMPPAPPASLWQFLTDEARRGRSLPAGLRVSGGTAWALWAFEGLLVLTGVVGLVSFAAQGTYCNACHRWYRPIRTGQARGGLAKKMSQRYNLPQPDVIQYHISSCPGGCSPICCECEYMEASGKTPVVNIIWLTATGRNDLFQLLDDNHS